MEPGVHVIAELERDTKRNSRILNFAVEDSIANIAKLVSREKSAPSSAFLSLNKMQPLF